MRNLEAHKIGRKEPGRKKVEAERKLVEVYSGIRARIFKRLWSPGID
jgi:hypothetical protein